ncbi:MAG: Ribosomal protein L25/L23 [uncultured bacterium]|nr:MAG: Ribosomal protein L25/L23 [uncultured bacterium]
MNKEKLTKIILAPCISEKSTGIRVDRQYVFRVRSEATKPEIAKAIEFLFDVDVDAVRVSNVGGKRRRFGNIQGRRKDWKKAYVTVKEGQAINLGGA